MNEKVESGLEVATFWVLFDATAEQRFIKKDARDGTLAFFDSEHQAIRAKRAHADTDYKRVDYVRQSDAERALQQQHERHRKTWRQLEQVTGLLKRAKLKLWTSPGDTLPDDITAALSQQAEPAQINQCDGCQAGIPADENGYHRMGKPGGYADLMRCEKARYVSEPAPAQDEREA